MTGGNNNFKNALNFINQVRACAIQGENRAIKLPELAGYAKTSTPNLTVNQIIEKEYIRFWQKMKKCDYEHDRKRLILLSRGAALESLKSPTKGNARNGGLPGVFESSLLLPILKDDLPLYILNCIALKEEHVFENLSAMIDTSKNYTGLEKELVLSAVHLLDVASQISEYSWGYVSEEEKRDLRSDRCALKCIRDWDRSASISKILYFSFILHARQIITHVSNNAEEAKIVSSLQKDLELIIYNEFPFEMIWEVGWVDNGPYAVRFLDKGKIYEGSVEEVHLLLVKDGRKDIGNVGNLFFKNLKLYASVEESYSNTYPGGWENLLRDLVFNISEKEFVVSENPMLYTLKYNIA